MAVTLPTSLLNTLPAVDQDGLVFTSRKYLVAPLVAFHRILAVAPFGATSDGAGGAPMVLMKLRLADQLPQPVALRAWTRQYNVMPLLGSVVISWEVTLPTLA